MQSITRQWIYAGLTVTGLIATWYFNLQLLDLPDGLSFTNFVNAMYANPMVGSVSNDVLIAFTTFLFWLVIEARRLAMPHWWIYIVCGMGIAFAFAFPLFLLMRERQIEKLSQHSLNPVQ